MGTMPLVLSWSDLVWRLATALAAGLLIGMNRGGSGNAAGLRTTLLVCLAACIAMLQVNVLMLQQGKAQDSFVRLDPMRLPLGILSGVGFIGAGSILHRDGLVQGVTTAATMWYVTVIGLCAGGGQIALAVAGTVLGLVVLEMLEYLERWLPRGRRAHVTLGHDAGENAHERLTEALRGHGCRIVPRGLSHGPGDEAPHDRLESAFEVKWRARPEDARVETALSSLVARVHDGGSWSLDR